LFHNPKFFFAKLINPQLTNARHVFMVRVWMSLSSQKLTSFMAQMDCWWNRAVEEQAIDRVHRIGQEHTVQVTQFIVSSFYYILTSY